MAKKQTPWEKRGVSQYMYEKYLKKYDDEHPDNVKKAKAAKKERRNKWWKDNWIALLSLITSVVAIGLTAWFELH